MGILRLCAGAVVCLGLASTGCVKKDFGENGAQNIIATGTYHLDAEQVSLNTVQIDCGVQNDLWDRPGPIMQERSVAHLLPAGKDLHFDDDVIFAEPGYRQPYVQVRGDFTLQLLDGSTIREEGSDGRVVEGRLAVVIPNMCFPDPLPLLGVRKGRFSQDVNPVMEFRLLNDGWHFTKLRH